MNGLMNKKGFVFPLVILLVILLLGASAVGAYYYYTNYLNKPAQQQVLPLPQQASPVAVPKLTLSVTSPVNGVLASNSQVNVTGKTKPNVAVAIFTDTDSSTVQSDDSGNFSGTVKLDKGINSLTVSVFDDDGTQVSQSMDVVYDSAT